MNFINGWLGLCNVGAAGAAVDVADPGTSAIYRRQRIAFNLAPPHWAGEGAARALLPRAVSCVPFSFGLGLGGAGGYGVFDAPVGGNLLLAIPYGSGVRQTGLGPSTTGTIITLEGPMFDPSYSGKVAAAAVMGSCYDDADIIGTRTPAAGEVQGPEGFVTLIKRGVLTTGVALVINRGVLQSAVSFAALA